MGRERGGTKGAESTEDREETQTAWSFPAPSAEPPPPVRPSDPGAVLQGRASQPRFQMRKRRPTAVGFYLNHQPRNTYRGWRKRDAREEEQLRGTNRGGRTPRNHGPHTPTCAYTQHPLLPISSGPSPPSHREAQVIGQEKKKKWQLTSNFLTPSSKAGI